MKEIFGGFVRGNFVLIHRYAGLAMTIILILVGVTGTLLAFYHELDALINPRLHRVGPGARLDPGELAERAQRLAPGALVNSVWLANPNEAAEVSVSPRPDPVTGNSGKLDYDQILLDPITGEELLRREWGAITQGWHNLFPFIYKFHYSLALNDTGGWILGITALVWTIDCFIGFYLTLPVVRSRREGGRGRGWWKSWRPSWLIKWPAGPFRLNFDIHRAFGLWTWVFLFVLAWSSVAFNLSQVYRPVMMSLFAMTDDAETPKLNKPLETPRLDWRRGYAMARNLMAEQSAAKGFTIVRDQYFGLDRERGIYTYSVMSSADVGRYGETQIDLDANTGKFLTARIPGFEPAGDLITNWLIWIHTAAVFGLTMQVLIFVMGIVIVALSITGVYLWWKKLRARRIAAQRRITAENG
jgi:uncharacterized iron-regulated membrane protein